MDSYQKQDFQDIHYCGKIDLKKFGGHKPLKTQKVTTLNQYQDSMFLLATLNNGYLVAINFLKLEVKSIIRPHKGNITSLTFMNDSKYMATSSGSFDKHHDNTINIYRVLFVINDLIIRRVHALNNAHGKVKGVMSVKASNRHGDNYLISAGGSDNGYMTVWNYLKKEPLNQVYMGAGGLSASYNLNLIFFNKEEALLKRNITYSPIAELRRTKEEYILPDPDDSFAIEEQSLQEYSNYKKSRVHLTSDDDISGRC